MRLKSEKGHLPDSRSGAEKRSKSSIPPQRSVDVVDRPWSVDTSTSQEQHLDSAGSTRPSTGYNVIYVSTGDYNTSGLLDISPSAKSQTNSYGLLAGTIAAPGDQEMRNNIGSARTIDSASRSSRSLEDGLRLSTPVDLRLSGTRPLNAEYSENMEDNAAALAEDKKQIAKSTPSIPERKSEENVAASESDAIKQTKTTHIDRNDLPKGQSVEERSLSSKQPSSELNSKGTRMCCQNLHVKEIL